MLKTRLILPLAVVSVAFLWACQEASGPTGLDSGTTVPNFGHNPNAPPVHGGGGDGETEDGTFAVSFEGDVDGEGELQGPHGGKNVLQEEFQVFVDLNLAGFRNLASIDNGTDCFSSTDILSGMQVGQVKPSNTKDAIIRFFFDAMGTDGESANYALTVFATFDDDEPGDWPPAEVIMITGTSFVLAHSNGPGNKAACTGEGDLTFNLTVTRN